jgi:hypothetical protein
MISTYAISSLKHTLVSKDTAQLVGTLHIICRDHSSNPDTSTYSHRKKVLVQ